MSKPRITDPPDPETVRCPTCRAQQPWSDTCRRCQSDLTLLHKAARSYHHHRRACLRQLQAGQAPAAMRAARRCRSLCDGPDSRRLEALSALLQEDWPAAHHLAIRCNEEDA